MSSARMGIVKVHVNAPAEQVWRLISDLERMGGEEP